jgi:imidazoleglycerol-phosphate dehydratase / histidinol-phosphatase
MKKKLLFIDRDGVLVVEPPVDYQLDSYDKLKFYPKVFSGLGRIARELDFDLVLVSNQDGLGTASFPEEDFYGPHNLVIETLKGEGITFIEECIDKTFPFENASTRKPNIGMLKHYISDAYDLSNSYVIGDRFTDMELAKNIGAKGVFMKGANDIGLDELTTSQEELFSIICLQTTDWDEIYTYLKLGERTAVVQRKTNETDISIELNLDGTGRNSINTGINFFDHMLEQIAKHGGIDLQINVVGDLEVDEHHTIEDTAIALGECFDRAIGSKIGANRYGFCLPMDDCLAQVSLDFGGRNWLVWDAEFKREMIGKMPSEMFVHFFKSFSDAARCNLNIKAEGVNEHHKIEAIFKAFAKAIKMAKTRDGKNATLPSTKGML